MNSYSLLFDIGMVIVEFDFHRSANRIADYCATAPEDVYTKVVALKDELEKGALSSDDYIDQTIDSLGFTGDRQLFIEAYQDVFTLNRPMVELIFEESDRGTPLYLLSNTSGLHIPFLFENYPVFHLFDAAVYSHEVRMMKPDLGIYRQAIDKLLIEPSKTIYVDDLEANCEAGKEMGFVTLKYEAPTDHDRFLSDLHKAKQGISQI